MIDPLLSDVNAACLPTFADVLTAAARLAGRAHVTPMVRSRTLDALTGAQLHFKCENLQRGGAFKFRGAANAVNALDDAVAARGVVTHSSGNHGAALALAARERGIPAHVVVPEGAIPGKLAAIRAYGATLHSCAPTMAAREAAAAQVQAATGATLVHPFADAHVIAGQGTAALELLAQAGPLDRVLVPIGGGGLVGGTAIAVAARGDGARVIAAEPAGADEAWRSLQAGRRIVDGPRDTICDGLRGTIADINFALLRNHGVEILRVDDDATRAAQALIAQRLKLVVEPSSAIVLAAILGARERFAGLRIGLILSGGNVA
ncbi:MAG: threonine ammonia-lyase [Arenimonas sp.]